MFFECLRMSHRPLKGRPFASGELLALAGLRKYQFNNRMQDATALLEEFFAVVPKLDKPVVVWPLFEQLLHAPLWLSGFSNDAKPGPVLEPHILTCGGVKDESSHRIDHCCGHRDSTHGKVVLVRNLRPVHVPPLRLGRARRVTTILTTIAKRP